MVTVGVLRKIKSYGFALPTIMIASVVMLIVLATAVQATTTSSLVIKNQYYNQLAREAAESAIKRASTCLRQNSYEPTWSDARPLTPATDCSGTTQSGLPSYVMSDGNIRTTFEVKYPTTGSAGSLRVLATAKTELLRTSNGTVWRSYNASLATDVTYQDSPQISGGAGWADSGHLGLFLSTTGQLYGFGDNSVGQLDSLTAPAVVSSPYKMELPSGVNRV